MGIVLDQFLNQILNDPTNQDKRDLTYRMVSELKRIFNSVPDIYILEHDAEKKIITARYKVDDSTYIEIPIGFARTALSGRYTGKFKRNQNLRISDQDQQ